MRVKIGALFFVFLIVSSFYSLTASPKAGLVWRMAALKWADNSYTSVPFKRPISMKAGDSFQIFVQADAECYCYIFAKDVEGNLESVFNAMMKPRQGIFLPDADNDFSITADSNSIQKLYIVMSSKAQPKLDSLLAKSKVFRAGAAADGLEDLIFCLRDQGSTLGEQPEKPVAMGGVTRGNTTINANESTQFEGRGMYVKTISIER